MGSVPATAGLRANGIDDGHVDGGGSRNESALVRPRDLPRYGCHQRGYLTVRDDLTTIDTHDDSQSETASPTDRESAESPEQAATQSDGAINPESQSQARVLDFLPDDERRILEPVIFSPGITQIELRDRSDFSKSKVSQTVSALEKRGLLYRERQGRTYRVYPSDDLRQSQS